MRPVRPDDDRGAASVFVIVAMTAILLGAGLAIDVGQYVVEARSAQNTADATVLAVATDCARTGSAVGSYAQYRQPGQTVSGTTCGGGVATVTATRDVEGRLLQLTAGAVSRSAEARWGTLASAPVAPIVLSSCEFSQALLDGTAEVVFYLDDTRPQTGCSSLPGGFSQLASSGCETTVTAGSTAPGDPGADLQKVVACITSPTGPALPFDVMVPLYDSAACAASGCTGRGPYPIRGFAALRITGYSFNGNNNDGTLGRNCPDRTRGRYCLQADFVRFTTSLGTPGSSGDFGVTRVYLSR
ncbi:Tad domain-containing protein [Ilumatobacter sp.]|uniref:Tad domain-containing protein n=1 Tax=Ilumatobacter sp. TaxID=1967498 RepID=UPI003B527CF7